MLQFYTPTNTTYFDKLRFLPHKRYLLRPFYQIDNESRERDFQMSFCHILQSRVKLFILTDRRHRETGIKLGWPSGTSRDGICLSWQNAVASEAC